MSPSASPKPRIAVIGLGSMGFGMATSLKRAGFAVTGCDVSEDAVRRFVAEGAFVTLLGLEFLARAIRC